MRKTNPSTFLSLPIPCIAAGCSPIDVTHNGDQRHPFVPSVVAIWLSVLAVWRITFLKFLYELEKTCCMDYDTCRRLDHFTWTCDPRFSRDINGYICFCLVEIYNVRKRAKQRGVVWRHVTMVPKFLDHNNRERRQREWQKSITVWHEILRVLIFAIFCGFSSDPQK